MKYIVILALALGTSVGVCGSLPVIRYGGLVIWDPVPIGIAIGSFERHGIRVEIVSQMLGGPIGLQAIAAGQIHATLCSIPGIINAVVGGLPVIGVADIQSSLFADEATGALAQPLQVWFVRRDSPIYSVANLRGKNLAVNLWRSSFHYTLLFALDAVGIKEDEVTFTLLPFQAQVPAILGGRVDVIGLMEPHVTNALRDYSDQLRVLVDALYILGQVQFSTIAVDTRWATAKPHEVRAFVAGIVDAIAWSYQYPDEAKAIIAQYTNIPVANIPNYRLQPNGRICFDSHAWWIETLVRFEGLDPKWKPADFGTNEYNPVEG